MNRIPTMIEYLNNEWDEGDGLPGPSYRRKYGVDPCGPEACGETREEWDARMERNRNNVTISDQTERMNPGPTCMCGEPMTHREWTEPAVEGGTRTVYGVACSTDGCPGNFPQVWERIIEKGKKKTDDVTELTWRGVTFNVQESYIKPSPEYPMGSYLRKVAGEVQIATGFYEKQFPGHPSPYFHGSPPFVLIDTGDWEWDRENDGKTKAE